MEAIDPGLISELISHRVDKRMQIESVDSAFHLELNLQHNRILDLDQW